MEKKFRLLENKKELDNDKLLKVYEKIILLLEAYLFELIYAKDYMIHYFHRKRIEKNSPLFYAYEFLHNFIEDLNYDSNFYYPLLSIDGGLYKYNLKKKHGIEFISIYGFNMLSINDIKNHLKNMIPNVIIYSEYIKNDNAKTNPISGNVILNIKQFEKINIDKNKLDEFTSKHYGFIISKILMHEFFGHKKSSFSKIKKNQNSIISFIDENDGIKLINSDDINYDIYKDINAILDGENPDNYVGDSGYFIEYFFGKINNGYTLPLIDDIEKKTKLSKLLDPQLWHKNISTFKEYIKLKSIYCEYFPENEKYYNISIYEEIESMKKEIIASNIKLEDEELNNNIEDEKKPVDKIDKLFNYIFKSRKDIILKKKKQNEIPSKEKEEKKKSKKTIRELIFEDFPQGFYRK